MMSENPYLTAPLDRVRWDALDGVSLARQAWRLRDPAGAAKALGAVVEPTETQQRVLQATTDFFKAQPRRRGRKHSTKS